MEPTRWLSAEEQNTWRAYLDATRLLLQALDRQLTRDAGISFTDFELLVVLSEAPQRQLRMRELADAVTTTRSGVTRAISRLVDTGWVRRVECEDDKRGTLAELTDAGAEKLAAASPGHVAEVRRNMFDLLSPRDVGILGHDFSEMRTHLLEHP
ncbi:MarR family winged helix-turn-helix transcriptional regulator [Rhodococcus opacus]|uniref:MarR family transcriptional regulator n=3 Tax=Rhodococcus opacus TaxID=37919 RepID=A0A1B1JX80_RHOOP|nr:MULTISPECIES: MarR family transcriptional regulator [Rhodococcus]NHU44747.1 MarR family transcriptional regulator [Rhodococcus sp. A14]ANS24960.1 MarR family transcriptional regulator [Rhodococcus opacus]EID81080.1 MarR family transcriptional regulator [Rhodococcus opacus RKJ300 = JCM 13270]EKT82099.1 MarR family transcriptional regulator [Rhodococcus opacus M213]MBA8960825.1 DNA-binding MarR family transcriptional regulator [Rhodococcus opacus]